MTDENSVILYVLCYDNESFEAAHARFRGFAWARVTLLPCLPGPNKYMEGEAFLSVLKDKRHEWKDAQFVGTLSWKAVEKLEVGLLQQGCDDAIRGGVEVVAFLPSTEPLVAQALRAHPRFLEVWLPLLTGLGASLDDAVSINIPTFFCNYWVATPKWMDRFLDFYAQAARLLETMPEVQDALWSNPGYATSLTSAQCQRIYNKPYIPYHPFVCERLASYFFWRHGAKLLLMQLGRQDFWTKYYTWEEKDVHARANYFASTFQCH